MLLVDDDELVRDVLCDLLSSDYDLVTCFANAEQALQSGIAEPDVVITDINLGAGMDGLRFGEEIRKRWRSTGVIYISGLSSQMHGRVLGPQERFVAKPFKLNELRSAIRAVQGSA